MAAKDQDDGTISGTPGASETDGKKRIEPLREDALVTMGWGQYREWAKTSRTSKSMVNWTRLALLILTVVATLLAYLSEAPDSTIAKAFSWLLHLLHFNELTEQQGFYAALAAASVAIIASLRRMLTPEREIEVLGARARAEAVKSLVYQYIMHVGDFKERDQKARKAFEQKLIAVAEADDAPVREALTKAERREGLPSPEMTICEYNRDRVDDQIAFYGHRVQHLQDRSQFLDKATFTIGILAAAFGAAIPALSPGDASTLSGVDINALQEAIKSAVGTDEAKVTQLMDAVKTANQGGVGWLAVASGITVALTTYITNMRYDVKIKTFQSALMQLRVRQARWLEYRRQLTNTALKEAETQKSRDDKIDLIDEQYVADCEAIMQEESREWLTKQTAEIKDGDEKTPKAP